MRIRIYLISVLVGIFVGQYVAIYVLAHTGNKILQKELEEYLANV